MIHGEAFKAGRFELYRCKRDAMTSLMVGDNNYTNYLSILTGMGRFNFFLKGNGVNNFIRMIKIFRPRQRVHSPHRQGGTAGCFNSIATLI